MNRRLNHTKKVRQRHFVLRVDCFTGRTTTRDQHEILDEDGWNVQEIPALYVIVRIDRDGAEIVDDGYPSMEEAQEAWPNALAPRLNSATEKAHPTTASTSNKLQKSNGHGINQK